MSNQNANQVEKRKDKFVNSALDTGVETLSKCVDNFIEKNLPQAMNWTVENINDFFIDVTSKEHHKISDIIR